MTLADGTRLGPYEISEPLGAGVQGKVCKAHDSSAEPIVAAEPRRDNNLKNDDTLSIVLDTFTITATPSCFARTLWGPNTTL